jgi:leucyl aminopeptidase
MEKLGMGSLLAVARGSRSRPSFIVWTTAAATRAAPVVLVGKGVTFDSGGISLKPGAAHGRDEVRHVRRGQRARRDQRLRAAEAAAERGRHRGPATENMPDGQATKPG